MERLAAERKRFLIVHNPVAGRKRRNLLDQVCEKLAAAGAIVTVEQADSASADRDIAQRARNTGKFDVVVAAGGDSTIRGVASGLVDGDVPLGIIPIGTGNVLAHEIGLARTPDAVAGCLLHGEATVIHPGRANNEIFLLMASLGPDVAILNKLNMRWKNRIGKLAYIVPTLRTIATAPRQFTAIIDGQSRQCSWLVITKAVHYGGTFVIAPRQRLTDESLHALLISATTRTAMIRALAAIMRGVGERNPDVVCIPCREVKVPNQTDLTWQIDGEPTGATPLHVGMAPQRLRLIIPEC